jgi:hypothetical protein
MKIFYWLFFILSFLISCSKNPDPAVSYLPELGRDGLDQLPHDGGNDSLDDTINNGEDRGVTDLPTVSLLYSGGDFFGSSCNFTMVSIQDDSDQWKIELEYILHGKPLPSVNVKFNSSRSSFIAVLLKDGSYGDHENINDYMDSGDLSFYLELQLKNNFDIKNCERDIDLYVNQAISFEEVKKSIDHIDRVIFRVWHISHYDAGGCWNYQLDKAEVYK